MRRLQRLVAAAPLVVAKVRLILSPGRRHRLVSDRHRDAATWTFAVPPAVTAPWNGDSSSFRLLNRAHSVFAFRAGDRQLVLKLVDDRDEATLLEQIAWSEHLAGGGVRVARAVASSAGRFVEPVAIKGRDPLLACAYEFVAGSTVDLFHAGSWDEQLLRRWGALSARTHALAPSFTAPAGATPRDLAAMRFDEVARLVIPPEHAAIIDAIEADMAWMRGLRRTPDVFGMIHADLTQANFIVADNGELVVFDFDASRQSWYAYDFAAILFSIEKLAVELPGKNAARILIERFFRAFIAGYAAVNGIPAWLPLVPRLIDFLHRVQVVAAFEGKRAVRVGALLDSPAASIDYHALAQQNGARPLELSVSG
ncbi:MAG TPA: phosphotransferase [Thermoanaerobaculia bacterium]|jgi:Ser/Thr protein kinase RdoA (MazF antagonist)|nr:phosphotransferase [Thermoanaerobaculia bacterium]